LHGQAGSSKKCWSPGKSESSLGPAIQGTACQRAQILGGMYKHDVRPVCLVRLDDLLTPDQTLTNKNVKKRGILSHRESMSGGQRDVVIGCVRNAHCFSPESRAIGR